MGSRDEECEIHVGESEEEPSEIQSSARHEEPCMNNGGPPPKAKYYQVTDRVQYREGKVKRTPGGE